VTGTDDRVPRPVEVVNLTGHPVDLDIVHPASGEPATTTTVTVPAAGGMARVAEPRVGQGTLLTSFGSFHEVRLRRTDTVDGLPPERAGLVYLVPRLTALAASSRSDLAFPHAERRDSRGRVLAAGALARFEPPRRRRLRDRAPAVALLSAFRRTAPQRLGDVTELTRWTGVVFALATALLSAPLGVLPDLVASDPRTESFRLKLLGGFCVLAVGILALVSGTRLWRRRSDLVTRRGTAYVIDELADSWTYEEKRSFLDGLTTHFAVVLHVPGPADLGASWRWPLGPGASEWTHKVDDLVRAFWAVQYNDDQVTHNAIFGWAWWPVSMAFAARATACRRGLVLRVRRRPSDGREGRLEGAGWDEQPHSFVRDPDLVRIGTEPPPRQVTVTVTPHADLSTPPHHGASRVPAPVTVLLVRMTNGVWGDSLTTTTPTDQPIALRIEDAAGTGVAGTSVARLLEWRCVVPPGTFHPWQGYPALAQSATEWIGRTASECPGPVLLGLLAPAEVAIGIGNLAGATPEEYWPEHLWPVHVDPGDRTHLVIPGLDLGWADLHRVGRS
jgi:hypothetical protein